MHVASGLSGPPLAAYAVGDKWEQRRFAASVQIIFAVFSVVSVALRGLPQSPVVDVWLLVGATVAGIVLGTLLTRFVPTSDRAHRDARDRMGGGDGGARARHPGTLLRPESTALPTRRCASNRASRSRDDAFVS